MGTYNMTKWDKKRVFVSGGAGVIGTALVKNLLERGAQVLIGDLKHQPEALNGLVYYRHGDLINMKMDEAQEFAPEVFFHLAATFERSEESEDFWHENFHHNVSLSHHMMSILKDLPSLKQVIFASSYLIYDPSLYLFRQPHIEAVPLKETSMISPRNLCGMAKLQHEHELAFVKKFRPQLQTISARIFRSYGKNSKDIISRWIRSLLEGKEITLYRPEGRFDFVYAEDVAHALMLLANTYHDGVVNIGTGRSKTIGDVINVLKNHFPKMSIKLEESDIPFEASQADMNKFYQLTGWKDFHSLEQIIPEIVAYEKFK